MAENTSKTNSSSGDAGNTATTGDHDRVQMLSLNADGTPDQVDPELIGDPELTAAATREQYRQQAVSAVDVDARGAIREDEYADAPQDPTIADLEKRHQAAEKAAEKAADATLKKHSRR